MKTKLLIATLAALACGASTAVYAADAAPATTNIAVVNVQKVMGASTAAKSVREQIESKQKAFQTDISKKVDALQKEKQEIGKQQSVLSKAAFEEKARAFSVKETEVQKEVQSKKSMLDNGFERALSEIQKATVDIVAELSKEKNFILAVPTSQILYADNKLDISDEVIDRLNKKLPKVDVKFDAKEPKADKK
ncbi:MAG: OmpH family outer membrane protein [Rickettsiales bacterium]|nr:OmpH family outer membrane protein [Rickettsiales bacterium]